MTASWNRRLAGTAAAAAMVALAAATGSAPTATAQAAATAIDVRAPIEIVADALEVQQDRRTATFAGNVNATQGPMILRADTLKVAYAAGGGANAITHLDATGKVFLSTPQETAQGAAANYDVGTGIITLTGSVILTRGENVIRGEKLVLNLASGASRMEGGAGADGRVRALVEPGGAP